MHDLRIQSRINGFSLKPRVNSKNTIKFLCYNFLKISNTDPQKVYSAKKAMPHLSKKFLSYFPLDTCECAFLGVCPDISWTRDRSAISLHLTHLQPNVDQYS